MRKRCKELLKKAKSMKMKVKVMKMKKWKKMKRMKKKMMIKWILMMTAQMNKTIKIRKSKAANNH